MPEDGCGARERIAKDNEETFSHDIFIRWDNFMGVYMSKLMRSLNT